MGGITQKANIAKAQIFSNSLRNSLMMNLISEWKFDDIVNLGKDNWGSNDGSLNGSVISSSDCISGKCLSLDGVGAYVDCGTNNAYNFSGQSFSISAWFKTLNSSTNIDTIIAKSETLMTAGFPKGYGLWVRYDNHKLLFKTGDGSTQQNISGTTTCDDANWHYAVGVFNITLGKIYLYLDGKIEGDNSIITSNLTNTDSFKIGNSTSSNGSCFKGLIDDVRIYNAAIPTSQIKEQYYIGLNQLLASGGIDNSEYQIRLAELNNPSAYSK